ncbi:septum site-determining protein MinC [Alkaliphilus metalliredigens QYMF]|uniref:Probable septum site-determining protein MinC n=1 Tax=Alkaliphilus metalliredigens (strain QYMF) TaxID=293826 RepID=A6TQI3_ALKMQ|nr:septum site-determining protein MinC [Alkaliphilus metalliredigens]ABR48451.1 septum site-determining protein MinC [Alkaliphilus metalliredigens QYMF]
MTQDNVIEFKGTKKGILVRIKPEIDFNLIKTQLIQKLEHTESFFKGAEIADIECDSLSFEERKELENLMTNRYQMIIHKKEVANIEEVPQDSVFDGINEGVTKFISGTLRSGRKIAYEGNIVILGDVNPGAQITAYGNIIVMGSLRGIAHAGANGNINACVAAFYLDPMQLRIGDIITRAPDGEYEKPNGPELARIKDNMVYIEPYLTKK